MWAHLLGQGEINPWKASTDCLFPETFQEIYLEESVDIPKGEIGTWTQGKGSSMYVAMYMHPQGTPYFMYDVHYSTQEGDNHALVYLNDTLWSKALHSAKVGGPAQIHKCNFHSVLSFQHVHDHPTVFLLPFRSEYCLTCYMFNMLVLRSER